MRHAPRAVHGRGGATAPPTLPVPRRLRAALFALVPALLIAGLHHLALGQLDGSVLIAQLLAPNPAEAAPALILGALFLALRITTLALLPGVLLALFGLALLPPLATKRSPGAAPAER